jgi:hypothetical protein
MSKPRPDRTGYTDLSVMVRVVRPACPKCGESRVANEGSHNNIGYFACDSCRSRFKARIAYIERDARFFRHTESPTNYSA